MAPLGAPRLTPSWDTLTVPGVKPWPTLGPCKPQITHRTQENPLPPDSAKHLREHSRSIMERLPNLRSLEVKFYGPTNHRGDRIRIRDLRGIIEKPLWISYSYTYDNAHDQAREHLESLGWSFVGQTMLPETNLLLTDDFCRESWEMPEVSSASQEVSA